MERVRDERDRRVMLVRLTADGQRTLEQIAVLTNARIRDLLACLSEAELETVRRTMEVLTAATER